MKVKLNLCAILFFSLYIILPSYFAIEITSKIPLITASRILLIILIINYCLSQKGIIRLRVFKDNKMKRGIALYFILMLISNIYYMFRINDAIKEILIIVLEEFLVIWIITQIIDSKTKLERALEYIVTFSGIVAVIAIISSIIGKNLFYYLNTVSREMLMADFTRLGFSRAEAGFGHAVYYGGYCVCVIPIIMYFIEQREKNLKYIICLALNILALIFCNSRGSLIIFLVMMAYMIFEKKPKKIVKYVPLIVFVIVGICFVCLINITFLKFIENIWISIVNVFSTTTTEIENYGANVSGLESRTSQFSQVVYTMKENAIFGLGAAAQVRKAVKWYNPYAGKWQPCNTFDVGYFAIICQYGICGAVGYFFLYKTIIKYIYSKKYKKYELIKTFKYFFIAYFLMLLSITGVNALFWVFLGLFIATVNLLENEEVNERGKIYDK